MSLADVLLGNLLEIMMSYRNAVSQTAFVYYTLFFSYRSGL